MGSGNDSVYLAHTTLTSFIIKRYDLCTLLTPDYIALSSENDKSFISDKTQIQYTDPACHSKPSTQAHLSNVKTVKPWSISNFN